MFDFIKQHPFAVEAFFDTSTVLTFSFPKENLQPLIPKHLELDTLHDRWGFVAMAMVQTKHLRPKGFPEMLGNNFFLIGYRIFVRYNSKDDKNLRGLYIIKSQTDKKKMEIFGNFFTHYNYTTIDISHSEANGKIEVSSRLSEFKIEFETSHQDVALPPNSPFVDWKEARRFAGPLPFTFTYIPATEEMIIIEGVRENWTPNPIKVTYFHVPYLNSLNIGELTLANAFMIRQIPYLWKKGRTERWTA
jgi:hypothetical protein